MLVGKPEGKRPLGRPSIDEMIILKWIRSGGKMWTVFMSLWVGTSGGLL
jgi:hypothetical protein